MLPKKGLHWSLQELSTLGELSERNAKYIRTWEEVGDIVGWNFLYQAAEYHAAGRAPCCGLPGPSNVVPFGVLYWIS